MFRRFRAATLLAVLAAPLAGCNLPPRAIAASPNSIVLERLNPPYGAGLQASFDQAGQHCARLGRDANFMRTVPQNVGLHDVFECRPRPPAPAPAT